MPLYRTIQLDPTTVIRIWKIEESLEWLSDSIELTPHCQQRVDGMKSEIHRRGFMSIRHLLAAEGYRDSDLYYDTNGKPHLLDGKHISITHSYSFSGIIISQAEVGIDIEKQRHKIIRIAHKFTQPEAYRSLGGDEELVRKLTRVWGAKESLYKSFAQPGTSFLDHIEVEAFDLADKTTTARVRYLDRSHGYRVWFEEFEGFTCAYAKII